MKAKHLYILLHEIPTKALLQSGADTSITDNLGQTPLHSAVTRCSDSAKLLINHNNQLLNTAIKTCLLAHHTRCGKNSPLNQLPCIDIKCLCKLTYPCYSINQQDKAGNTPLHLAAKLDNIELVKLLLANGANCLIRNNDHLRPSFLAKDVHVKNILRLAEALAQTPHLLQLPINVKEHITSYL